MYVEAVDEVGGDAVEDPTEEEVVTAAELGFEGVAEEKEEDAEDTIEEKMVTADELGLEDVAEEKAEDVEAAVVVDDTICELEETAD